MKLVQDNKTHKITANESQSVGVLSLMAVPMFWCAPLSGGCREELRAFGGEFLRESRGAYVADSGADTRCVPIGVTCALFSCLYDAFRTSSLRGLRSENWSTRVFVGFDLRTLFYFSPHRFATMTASGCPCFVLRAASFVCRLIASQLALAISFRFGARTPCCGHGLDHRRRQSHRRSGKLEQLNNQVHGRITSFRGRRRCQHTGLTPLTLHDCIINIRTNVPKYRVNSSRKCERRAA